jgi:hypothetical protein
MATMTPDATIDPVDTPALPFAFSAPRWSAIPMRARARCSTR